MDIKTAMCKILKNMYQGNSMEEFRGEIQIFPGKFVKARSLNFIE